MIKVSGSFILWLFTKNLAQFENVSLTIQGTLMPLFMTSVQSIARPDSSQVEIDFEIPVENMVIKKGQYRIKLTGTDGVFKHITLINRMGHRNDTIFSVFAETEVSTKSEIKIKFTLPKKIVGIQTSNTMH